MIIPAAPMIKPVVMGSAPSAGPADTELRRRSATNANANPAMIKLNPILPNASFLRRMPDKISLAPAHHPSAAAQHVALLRLSVTSITHSRILRKINDSCMSIRPPIESEFSMWRQRHRLITSLAHISRQQAALRQNLCIAAVPRAGCGKRLCGLADRKINTIEVPLERYFFYFQSIWV